MKALAYLIGICISFSFIISCSKDTKTIEKNPDIQEIVVVDDGYSTNEDGALIIDDNDVKGRVVSLTNEKSQEKTLNKNDGSQVRVMYDGFGNKTITRFFDDHPLIAGMVARISAKGETKTLIYTKDGLVKHILDSHSEIIELSNANDIAKKVGIYSLQDGQKYKPTFAGNSVNFENQSRSLKDEIAVSTLQTNTPENSNDSKSAEPIEKEIVKDTNDDTFTPKTANNTFMNEFESSIEKTAQVEKRKSN